jgi:hypothetical protein
MSHVNLGPEHYTIKSLDDFKVFAWELYVVKYRVSQHVSTGPCGDERQDDPYKEINLGRL